MTELGPVQGVALEAGQLDAAPEQVDVFDPISEDEMVAEFLKAELASPRFAKRFREWFTTHGFSEDTDIATLDPELRKQLLRDARPGLFKTLPEDVIWHSATLKEKDWEKVQYMNQRDWNNFSGGTRRVLDGVKKLGTPNHETLSERVSEINAEVQGGKQLPKIILVAEPELEKLVLLEGHARATAYAASGKYREAPISVIIGTSEKAPDWAWY